MGKAVENKVVSKLARFAKKLSKLCEKSLKEIVAANLHELSGTHTYTHTHNSSSPLPWPSQFLPFAGVLDEFFNGDSTSLASSLNNPETVATLSSIEHTLISCSQCLFKMMNQEHLNCPSLQDSVFDNLDVIIEKPGFSFILSPVAASIAIDPIVAIYNNHLLQFVIEFETG